MRPVSRPHCLLQLDVGVQKYLVRYEAVQIQALALLWTLSARFSQGPWAPVTHPPPPVRAHNDALGPSVMNVMLKHFLLWCNAQGTREQPRLTPSVKAAKWRHRWSSTKFNVCMVTDYTEAQKGGDQKMIWGNCFDFIDHSCYRFELMPLW